MLKFERTWETLGIPQLHKISSQSLNGYCTGPAGIALPRRRCILISSYNYYYDNLYSPLSPSVQNVQTHKNIKTAKEKQQWQHRKNN